jgi:hypothetical protein
LLDTVRSYARERLGGALRDAHDAHAAYYLRIAIDQARHSDHVDTVLRAEAANVRSALYHVSTTRGWMAPAIRELGVLGDLAPAAAADVELLPLWWGIFAASLVQGHLAVAGDMASGLLAHADVAHPVTKAVAHVARGFCDFHLGSGLDVCLRQVRDARAAAERAPAHLLTLIPEHVLVAAAAVESLARANHGDASALRVGDEMVAFADETGLPFPRTYARTFAAWC